MVDLGPCPTPWCQSSKVHTTTFHRSKKDDDGTVKKWVEVDHSCPSCHVRTPQGLPPDMALLWNTSREGE